MSLSRRELLASLGLGALSACAAGQTAPQPVPPIEVRGRGGRVLGRIQVVLTPRKSQ